MRRPLWLAVERGGRESSVVIHGKLMSAQPQSLLALSWVLYTENHIYVSQSNKFNRELILPLRKWRLREAE